MRKVYVVSSSTTFTSKKTGLPFTSKGYFRWWVFGPGCGASFGSIDNAKRMTFLEARKVARFSPNYIIEAAPQAVTPSPSPNI